MNNFRAILCLTVMCPLLAYAVEYTYTGARGVDQWSTLFPGCAGTSQSPVNLMSCKNTVLGAAFFFFKYGWAASSATLTNNGHTAQFSFPDNGSPYLLGGNLPSVYKFLQGHFHWGADDTKGSEHTVNGVQYPIELHLVHYDIAYGSAAAAIAAGSVYKPTLAVLGILFEISNTDNLVLNNIIAGLPSIPLDGDTTAITPFTLMQLLPNDKHNFYRYKGSLTTPTCNEIVYWTVFKEPISISSSQLAVFRTLFDNVNAPLVDNFRPVQELNGRKVSCYNTNLGCPRN